MEFRFIVEEFYFHFVASAVRGMAKMQWLVQVAEQVCENFERESFACSGRVSFKYIDLFVYSRHDIAVGIS